MLCSDCTKKISAIYTWPCISHRFTRTKELTYSLLGRHFRVDDYHFPQGEGWINAFREDVIWTPSNTSFLLAGAWKGAKELEVSKIPS